ncbi:MAG: hypothetical protein IT209_09665 [Armatimonadetes bacterium]|nr:hypothetical protein [Armatimonadota bacterium]
MDLHIHTVLSPCAEVEMIPELIILQAQRSGLDMIAVCDHNAAENAGACITAACGSTVKVLAGIECESREGVHVLGIFDRAENALQLQDFIWSRLPAEPNRPEFFGAQMVVDASGEFIRFNDRMLAASADASVEELVQRIREADGLPLPAHVNKTHAGLLGVLGLMPEGLDVPAVEVFLPPGSDAQTLAKLRTTFSQLETLKCIRSSDAHRLEEIGQSRSFVWVESRSVGELELAFDGRLGRSLEELC